MRALLLLMIAAGQLWAQESGSRLDEILKPSPNKAFRGKGFEIDKSVETKGSAAKPFRFIQRMFTKPFATREYAGGKEYLTGEFKVVPANAGRGEAREAQRSARTKSAAVSEYNQSGLSAPTRSYATRGYTGERGRSQSRLESEGPAALADGVGWKGKLEPMSIDDVRELLNKSK